MTFVKCWFFANILYFHRIKSRSTISMLYRTNIVLYPNSPSFMCWYSNGPIRVRYGMGKIRFWYGYGTVKLRYGTVTVTVQLNYSYGTVQLRYGTATVTALNTADVQYLIN